MCFMSQVQMPSCSYMCTCAMQCIVNAVTYTFMYYTGNTVDMLHW